MTSYDSEKFGSTFQNLAARFKQHANETNDRFQEVASQAVRDEERRESQQSTKRPRQPGAIISEPGAKRSNTAGASAPKKADNTLPAAG
ncbi:hypothetical protein DV736_g1934, partial [Chaetothyriales sp. CBS 134916]